MKIFNWVHKKFHHKLPKDGMNGNGENTEPEGNTDMDTQGFLSQVAIGNGIDHAWRDGILTIGTFGFDPLKPFINGQSEYTVLEDEDEDGKESREFTHGGEDDDDCDRNNGEDTSDDNICEEELNPLLLTTSSPDTIVAEADVIEVSNEITTVENDHDSESDHMKKKNERVTLADLFKADGHDFQAKLEHSGKVQIQSELMKKEMKPVKTRKGGMGFAKKLIPRSVKEEVTPIKNVQRLMRRMLKRKIHPADLDVKKSTNVGTKEENIGYRGNIDDPKYGYFDRNIDKISIERKF